MYAKILGKILSIVSGLAKEEISVDEDTVLQADLNLTSLQVMELVLEVEDEFDISFPLNRLPNIRTVKELTEAIVATLDQ